jgi:uncharacterized cofD-like protein
MASPMKVVGIGGGTGLPVLLSGLKTLVDAGEERLDITAIVTASDSGGSTGSLRRAFNMPAVGDIRNCLMALSNADPLLTSVCNHRFVNAGELEGHSVGNVLISAFYQMSGNFLEAVNLAGRLLNIEGAVYPSTILSTVLNAEYDDGVVVAGEANIKRRAAIRRVWLEPHIPIPCPGVLQEIAEADVIVFGPGSLYTSVIPNLLVGGVSESIRRASAVRLYVCNLMTQPGETAGYSVSKHIRSLLRYLNGARIDGCIVNTTEAGTGLAKRYSASGSEIVGMDEDLGVKLIAAPLMKGGKGIARHDGLALARVVVSTARGLRQGFRPRRQAEQEVTCAELSATSVPEMPLAS